MDKAIFFDRDGTLIVDIPYLSDPDKVCLLPDVNKNIQDLKNAGFSIFLFTNQSGVFRKYFDLEAMRACNKRLAELLGEAVFTETCAATENPDRPNPYYRKPSPRFILEMIAKYKLDPRQTWMVGDKMLDVEAGINANVNAALIANPSSQPSPDAYKIFASVSDFTRYVLNAHL